MVDPRDAATRNFCDSNLTFFGNSATGEVLESAELQLTSCGFPVPEFNTAVVKQAPTDLAPLIERARNFYGSRNLPFALALRDDHAEQARAELERAGFQEAGRTPGMILEPLSAPPPLPPGLMIEGVTSAPELERFAQTAFAGFGIPVQAASLFLTEALLELAPVELLLGSVDGEAVASSALVQSGTVAGIYWVATLDAFRGRGFGTALTAAAAERGRQRGCRMASLQASTMGEPVYAAMGFETPLHYVRFAYPETQAQT